MIFWSSFGHIFLFQGTTLDGCDAVDANIEVGAKYIRISFTMYYVLTPTQANISNLDRL